MCDNTMRIILYTFVLLVFNIGWSFGQRTSSPSFHDRNLPRQTSNVSDDALLEISSQLFAQDINGAYGRLELNIQNRADRSSTGNRTDRASLPLFKKGLPGDLKSKPTYAKMLALYDNYFTAVNETEMVTNHELGEEAAFMDALINTTVMRNAHQFLVRHGLADARINRFKEYLRATWFGLYQRFPGKQGSSGFEHVFLGEWKNGISGLHSWVRFMIEEEKGAMNYLGYIKTLPLGRSSVGLIELPLEWQGVYKPFSTMMISTSPELDFALYTICFLARPDSQCPVQGPANVNSGNNRNANRPTRFRIQTHSQTYRGNNFIGGAYPAF